MKLWWRGISTCIGARYRAWRHRQSKVYIRYRGGCCCYCPAGGDSCVARRWAVATLSNMDDDVIGPKNKRLGSLFAGGTRACFSRSAEYRSILHLVLTRPAASNAFPLFWCVDLLLMMLDVLPRDISLDIGIAATHSPPFLFRIILVLSCGIYATRSTNYDIHNGRFFQHIRDL